MTEVNIGIDNTEKLGSGANKIVFGVTVTNELNNIIEYVSMINPNAKLETLEIIDCNITYLPIQLLSLLHLNLKLDGNPVVIPENIKTIPKEEFKKLKGLSALNILTTQDLIDMDPNSNLFLSLLPYLPDDLKLLKKKHIGENVQ